MGTGRNDCMMDRPSSDELLPMTDDDVKKIDHDGEGRVTGDSAEIDLVSAIL